MTTMLDTKHIVSALRRDAALVGSAVVAVVFIGFAGLAVAATVLDLASIQP